MTARNDGSQGARSGLEDALTVIRSAIQSEISGQRFYIDAAHTCIDPWAKEVFATLAEEEEAHTRLLLLEYQSLTAHGRWLDPKIAIESDAEVDITHFVFPHEDAAENLFPSEKSAEHAIDRRGNDLAALAFGIDMERKAIELYARGASETTDPAARKAYELLVSEETRHHQQLRDRWEVLAGVPFIDL